MTSGQNQETKNKKCSLCGQEFTSSNVNCPYDQTLLTELENPIGATLLGNYRIMETIGHGSMGIVYKARNEIMNRTVVVKVLNAPIVPSTANQLQREMQPIVSLSHPNLISVYDTGITADRQTYIVMDYLVGESLADVISRENHISPERAINLFMQALDALDYAHKKGVIHGDLKPCNIMLMEHEGKKDVVKVMDFGIARLMYSSVQQPDKKVTNVGEISGSPLYMSPEQIRGESLDARADIFSFGCIMYESLVGKVPLTGHTTLQTVMMRAAHGATRLEIPGVDAYLSEVISRCLSGKIENRFQTAEELAIALSNWRSAEVQNRMDDAVERSGPNKFGLIASWFDRKSNVSSTPNVTIPSIRLVETNQNNELMELLAAGDEEYRDNGEVTDTGCKFVELLESCGVEVIQELGRAIASLKISEPAGGWFLRLLGRVKEQSTLVHRRSLLEDFLSHESIYFRDGALIGLMAMCSRQSLPAIEKAAKREKAQSLKAAMVSAVAYLSEKKST